LYLSLRSNIAPFQHDSQIWASVPTCKTILKRDFTREDMVNTIVRRTAAVLGLGVAAYAISKSPVMPSKKQTVMYVVCPSIIP